MILKIKRAFGAATIFALATGNMKSAISVIRISGENTSAIKNMLSEHSKNKPHKPRYLHLENLYTAKTRELIDQVMLVQFEKNKSFTGEGV